MRAVSFRECRLPVAGVDSLPCYPTTSHWFWKNGQLVGSLEQSGEMIRYITCSLYSSGSIKWGSKKQQIDGYVFLFRDFPRKKCLLLGWCHEKWGPVVGRLSLKKGPVSKDKVFHILANRPDNKKIGLNIEPRKNIRPCIWLQHFWKWLSQSGEPRNEKTKTFWLGKGLEWKGGQKLVQLGGSKSSKNPRSWLSFFL